METRRRTLAETWFNVRKTLYQKARFGSYHVFFEPVDRDERRILVAEATPEQLDAALRRINTRLEHRGRSLSGTEIFIGLLFAGAVTFALGYKEVPAVWQPNVVGIALSLLVMLPQFKELFPMRAEEEARELLGRGLTSAIDAKRAQMLEALGRSHAQRAWTHRLRWGRLYLGLGLIVSMGNLLF